MAHWIVPADVIGKKFGRLTVVEICEKRHRRLVVVKCVCECGTEKNFLLTAIRNGGTKSCGCWNIEVICRRNYKHGHAKRNVHSSEYGTWSSMITRCTNSSRKSWKRYGGRGIIVCERWANSFENFLADMGKKPSLQHSIDRIDNNGNYEPGNCRWSVKLSQNRNRVSTRMLTHNGETRCITEWAEVTGVPRTTITKRLRRGLSLGEAIQARAAAAAGVN